MARPCACAKANPAPKPTTAPRWKPPARGWNRVRNGSTSSISTPHSAPATTVTSYIEMSGGVRDDASLDAALEAGAARVNIGTAALENPDWTASVIKKYGDRVAVGLDVRGHTLAARGWVKEGGDLFETMKFLDSVGCSRYVVTDVARDGMMSGPNIELLREVASRTDAKVTASGGISKLDDLRNIKELAELGVDAAILGKSLYARAFTLEEALEVAR